MILKIFVIAVLYVNSHYTFKCPPSESHDIDSCSHLSQHPSSCTELKESRTLDKISRLPPPGGTECYDRTLKALMGINSMFQKLRTLHIFSDFIISVVIDSNYDAMVGKNQSEFEVLAVRNLRDMPWCNYKVEDLHVRKGSVVINFRLSKTRSSDNNGKNHSLSNLILHPLTLIKRNSISASSTVDKLERIKEHTVISTDPVLSVSFTIAAKYPDVAQGKEEDFKQHILKQIAREIRVPISSIKDFTITTASGMTISLSLVAINDDNNVMDSASIVGATEDLKSKIRNKQLELSDLNGKVLVPAQHQTFFTQQGQSSPALSMAILGILIVVLILIGVLVITLLILLKKGITKMESPGYESRKKIYQETGIQETGRDSLLSMSGRYSYDSGLWMGPGPEPSFIAPEVTCYRPPTREQLTSTPRPVTAVRARLKNSWNIDTDLVPIPDENLREDNIPYMNHRYISEPI